MISSDDAAATLFEALALWRNNLEAQQSQQESTLPRKGKNPATSGDEEVERQRRIHLETVDRCLRVIPEMAAVIAKQPGVAKATDSVYTVPPLTPPHFPEEWEIGPEKYKDLSNGYDEPYVDPFTGNMIYPASWEHSAGPSGTRSPPRSRSPQPFHGARAASERRSQVRMTLSISCCVRLHAAKLCRATAGRRPRPSGTHLEMDTRNVQRKTKARNVQPPLSALSWTRTRTRTRAAALRW